MVTYHTKVDMVVFLDVDNTLINNDKVKTDVEAEMQELIGDKLNERFWEVYEQVRKEMDGVDIPATLRRLKPEYEDKELYTKLYRLWMDFPYHEYIFPGVFETLHHLKTFATPVILSDGDASFQIRKIVCSGLSRAIDGNVLVYQHKDQHFEDILRSFPANHYVMVEDKPTLLALGKEFFGEDITTVLVMQGKYAHQPSSYKPDMVLPGIGDLKNVSEQQLMGDKVQLG